MAGLLSSQGNESSNTNRQSFAHLRILKGNSII
jgi:hypothetical protein